jgi:hypothetical protein
MCGLRECIGSRQVSDSFMGGRRRDLKGHGRAMARGFRYERLSPSVGDDFGGTAVAVGAGR